MNTIILNKKLIVFFLFTVTFLTIISSTYAEADDTLRYTSQQNIRSINQPAADVINACMDFTWKAEADVVTNDGQTFFHRGTIYQGIPYRSAWTTASNVGWHITKQTFMNAANDPDSIFYHNPNTSKPGPFYSLVCSSFATLVCGFPYPMTNYSMMKDPLIIRDKLKAPAVGSLMTNGTTHCIVPMEWAEEPTGNIALTLAEQKTPLTVIREINYDASSLENSAKTVPSYMKDYIYQCKPLTIEESPYDITTFRIKNGSARPFLGDQSVYTSEMDVLINIKSTSANRLYFQKYDFICRQGLPVYITAVNEPQYINIIPGTKQITLRSATKADNSFTGVPLENGAIYGIWASKDATTDTAPFNVEYFEWYDLAEEIVQYTVRDGTLITDDVFWYALTNAFNENIFIREDKKSGDYSIPYQKPKTDKNGMLLEHSDYSNYAECAQLASPESVKVFFRKGKFGAYVTGTEIIS